VPPRTDLTVVITTRNRARMLAQALDSVIASSLIASPEQILVIDDDSHDEAELVALHRHTRYERVHTNGPSGARNAGIGLVSTPYVAFLDDDDLWLPNNMELQIAALDEHPEAAFAYGKFQFATGDSVPFGLVERGCPPSGRVPALFYLHFHQIGTVLFRLTALVEAGGFDTLISRGEDADLLTRVAAKYPVVGVDVTGILHRQHGQYPPSKARADSAWGSRRDVRKVPEGVHLNLTLRTRLAFRLRRLGRSFDEFCEDATACLKQGERRNAVVCLARAVSISPLHVARRRSFWAVVRAVV
jgi:glycosyltransferase involved in cell wall biosynthesis